MAFTPTALGEALVSGYRDMGLSNLWTPDLRAKIERNITLVAQNRRSKAGSSCSVMGPASSVATCMQICRRPPPRPTLPGFSWGTFHPESAQQFGCTGSPVLIISSASHKVNTMHTCRRQRSCSSGRLARPQAPRCGW